MTDRQAVIEQIEKSGYTPNSADTAKAQKSRALLSQAYFENFPWSALSDETLKRFGELVDYEIEAVERNRQRAQEMPHGR